MDDRRPAPAPEDGAEHDLAPELDKAHNFFGPIDDEIRARLRDLYDEPTPEKWQSCHGIILAPSPGFGPTLWQALVAVDPTGTPRSGPPFEIGASPKWTWAPTRGAIKAALVHATRRAMRHATARPEGEAQPENAGPAAGAAEIRAAVALSAATERRLAAGEADMRRLNGGPGWLKDMLARRARRAEVESHIRRRSPKGARAYEEARDRERRAASAAFSPGDTVGHVLDGAGARRRVEEVLGCGLVRLGEKPASRIASELAEPEDLWHADQTLGPPAAEPHRGRAARAPRHPSAAGAPRAAAQPCLFDP